MRNILIILIIVCLFFPGSIAASEKYAGDWNLVSQNLKVTVISWGKDCGPQPKSYSSNKVRQIKIISKGKHLVFSKGGVRTDRCWSPNPLVYTTSSGVSPGNWKRNCRTRKNDSKSEEGKYTLTAVGENTLNYLAESRFDWALKKDHCIARLVEIRKYLRVEKQSSKKEVIKVPEKPPKIIEVTPPPVEDDKQDECTEEGDPVKISLYPRKADIGPGQKICFTAKGTDSKGCKFVLSEVAWKVTQYGKKIDGIISNNGCFFSGETAADSEGEYKVWVRGYNLVSTAKISVVFPNLADLIQARLNFPAEGGNEVETEIPKEPEKSAGNIAQEVKTSETSPAQPAAPDELNNEKKEKKENSYLILIIVIISVIAVAGLIGFIIYIKKKKRDEFLDSQDSQGMVCPKCHRGYDSDALFCPHDAEKLVPYDNWGQGA